jgi:Ca2+-binding RTX toxin-like protein
MPIVNGTPGNDTLNGSPDDDIVLGRDGDDLIFGGSGDDILIGGAGNDELWDDGAGLTGDDDLLIGGAGNDFIVSGSGNDTLIGGEGDDFFSLFSGDLVIVGGDGIDTLNYGGMTADVTVDLGAGTYTGVASSGETIDARLFGIENYLHLGGGSTRITGSAADNVLLGGAGNDTLNGGLGNDTLGGESGSDHYVFDVAPGEENADRVIFSRDEGDTDRIVLDSDAMTELGAAGQLAADDERWYSAAGATGGAEADDRIVYDSDAGRLYYDADGSGAGAALLIATIANPAVSLTASDIVIA